MSNMPKTPCSRKNDQFFFNTSLLKLVCNDFQGYELSANKFEELNANWMKRLLETRAQYNYRMMVRNSTWSKFSKQRCPCHKLKREPLEFTNKVSVIKEVKVSTFDFCYLI